VLFNVRPGGWADLTGSFGWIVGINPQGEFVINWEFDQQPQDTCVLGNGNILFSLPKGGELREATPQGELVRSWHVPNDLKGAEAPSGSVPLDIPLFHHRINVFPNGNFLLLGAEARQFPNWPQKDDDPNAPLGDAKVVGDVIYEVSPTGAVVNQWSILDMLDPYRLCYGSCSVYWRERGIPGSFDWCHANDLKFASVSHVFQEHLGIAAMPPELKELALTRLREGRKRYEHYLTPAYINYESKYVQTIDRLINTIENVEFKQSALDQFIRHIKIEDLVSKKPLKEVVPDWAPWFD
jgi:hypothetical protein